MARAIDANRMKEELLWGNVFLSAKEINALVDLIDNQPTLTPPNEPLTLDELREMDGEPAYIPETNCWVLVTKIRLSHYSRGQTESSALHMIGMSKLARSTAARQRERTVMPTMPEHILSLSYG